MMSTNTIEQKLRNLQINIAQGRTQDELAQSGIYFPPSTTSTQQQQQPQNAFSNYIDSVHKALDSTKQQSKEDSNHLYYQSPYQHDYIQYDYKTQPSFQIHFNQNNQQRHFLNNNPPLTLPNVLGPPVPPRQSLLKSFSS